ncbi:MAG: hypothetical protein M3Q29_18835 [Chloroflexota bacterium]|nr:hypothetical protein [Chloroflexota bacterium]
MRHPSEGDLRARATGGEDAQVREHVRGCARCEAHLTQIERAAGLAKARLDGLGRGVQPNAPTVDPAKALQRFKATRVERNIGMTEFGKRRSLRPVLAGGTLVVALLAALLISPVRSAAIGLFDVFRVEKFAVITVDPSKLPVKMGEGSGGGHKGHGKLDINAFGTYEGPMKPEKAQEVGSLEEAEEVVGYAPATAGATLGGKSLSKTYVSKPFSGSYTFDTDEIRARLDAAGATSIKVPEQLDNKTFMLTAGRGVVQVYGTEKDGVLFAQGPSPELTIPEGVDMDYLRQDFLMIPGLPADLVAQIKEIEDWKHTLIIPVPAGGSSQDVKINGSEGVLISDPEGEGSFVIWQRDGKLYAIGGGISGPEALAAARAVEYR